jgi:maltose/maltodextrin transport system substrate-binding protein
MRTPRRTVVTAAVTLLASLSLSAGLRPAIAAAPADDVSRDALRPVFPGQPGVRPFWNKFSARFIYPPAFDLPEVPGAAAYHFTVHTAGGQDQRFSADKPWAPLSPVWAAVPEGVTEVTVDAVDAAGQVVGRSGTRLFYRSPGFEGAAKDPIKPYADAGRWALNAIYQAPHVQHWLADGKPDRSYDLYCYPAKVMGALVRAMVAYGKVAESDQDRTRAIEIARRVADHLISVSTPAAAPYPHFPPTYSTDVDRPKPAASKRTGKWMFVPAAVDAALGYLDLYDATHDAKYLDAAKAVAATYAKTQGPDGTWPIVVDFDTGQPLRPNRQNPTWILFLFDRLDHQYGVAEYRANRDRAWRWIVDNPLKTYRWEGQFEDGTPREPYKNLAREQACDVAGILLDGAQQHPEHVAQAEELLRFAEDQFVIWSPIKDVAGWIKVMPKRRTPSDQWITPCVMEQYGAYAPVARSSAILINTYLKAYHATKRPIYQAKARALANGLIAAQAWMAATYNGNGEIPTWLNGQPPTNWLNNSFYAAEAITAVGRDAASN